MISENEEYMVDVFCMKNIDIFKLIIGPKDGVGLISNGAAYKNGSFKIQMQLQLKQGSISVKNERFRRDISSTYGKEMQVIHLTIHDVNKLMSYRKYSEPEDREFVFFLREIKEDLPNTFSGLEKFLVDDFGFEDYIVKLRLQNLKDRGWINDKRGINLSDSANFEENGPPEPSNPD